MTGQADSTCAIGLNQADALPPGVPARVIAAQLDLRGAWSRVLAKAGMPGADGVPVRRFEREAPGILAVLTHELAADSYRPLPLRLVLLPKKNGGRRCLLVPTVRDRIVQAAIAAWLGARWNPTFDAASFAYRPGLGRNDALGQLADLRDRGFTWVLDADILSFFDSIGHRHLVERLRAVLGGAFCVAHWIEQSVGGVVWDGERLTRVTVGVPQGSPLSPILSNFFLDGFDRKLRAAGLAFVRYADDFLVLAKTPFALADGRAIVESTLRELGLSLNAEKTRETTFQQVFRFLGAEVRADNIWLPLPRGKASAGPVFVAPTMPPALLRAFRAGSLAARHPFEPRRWQPEAPARASAAESAAATKPVMDRLGGHRTESSLSRLRSGR